MPNASAKIGDVTQIYFDEKAISFKTCSIDVPPHTPISAWFFLDREQTKPNLKRT